MLINFQVSSWYSPWLTCEYPSQINNCSGYITSYVFILNFSCRIFFHLPYAFQQDLCIWSLINTKLCFCLSAMAQAWQWLWCASGYWVGMNPLFTLLKLIPTLWSQGFCIPNCSCLTFILPPSPIDILSHLLATSPFPPYSFLQPSFPSNTVSCFSSRFLFLLSFY